MKVERIAYGGPLYRAALQLRHRVLRVPLGLSIEDEDLAAESACLHYGVVCDGGLIACLYIVPGAGEARIRQMAVEPAYQRQGIGRLLLSHVERELGALGYTSVRLNARRSALGFYTALAYRASGPEFLELGIAHQALVKRL